ncbi:Photosystem I P700 chlorophyll a apoprotein A2 [Microbacterium oxydans]|uniref:Photosystem I P700 chlorophyll a apoprotein A2 n=1 Tax=Microbacterium oxydans TaxID=82380 RepID=A0A3S9WFZ1_9MICO|nr:MULTISPECIES: OmpA family protein [Microbacterium]AZS38996.1 Photosystem I P700 chlorophyll a apoprotein A2 [Microbacterium oxydans]
MTTARTSARRSVMTAGLVTALALSGGALAGCAPQTSAAPKPRPTSAPPAAAATVDTVPGYDVGQFPPVPLFVLPDLSLLDTSASAFTIEVNAALAGIPGVIATPAHCDATGAVTSGNGSAYLYGDGSGAFTGPDGTVQNFGDGSGTSTINGVTIQNFGDGSGNYSDGVVTIQNFGDGSGNYTDATKTVQIFGDGSGNYTDGDVTIQNFGDGSGNYEGRGVTIQNFGDGSGNYTDGDLTIQNWGDGTARVNGEDVEADPLPEVPRLGVFPPLGALAPLESCGTTLTFEDGVLFDFDRSDIRPDAAATLDAVAEVLSTLKVGEAVVSGHTDAIGDDDDNQRLSEDRADAVVDGLTSRDVSTRFTAEGFGERRPVAANEIDGADNPAGRQLNRRVEIFIPAAL